MGTGETSKQVRQGLSHLGFIAAVTLKHLAVKLTLTVSGNLEILNAPGRGDQVTAVGPVAIPTPAGRAFTPRGPRHCSSSSRMTCSSNTCTALTARQRKC